MKKIIILILVLNSTITFSQSVSMTDMSFWKTTGKNNWQVYQSVSADMAKAYNMSTKPGTGVLVNQPVEGNKANLQSVLEHGDADISFDFMMATHSNSGFYLQGRYEVQLLDSWGVKNPGTGDCGGIYKRRKFIKNASGKYDEYLFDGHAPRINTCLAPGLWQHMEISFQAPKFDNSGIKTMNAKILFIKMNGVVIHENVSLTGPTGGPIAETEVANGPIMIQGDHGAVAFRNMKIANLNGAPAELKNLDYQVFYGSFKEPKDFLNKKPDAVGKVEKLDWSVSTQQNNFAQIFKGNLKTVEAGLHKLVFQIGGKYAVKLAGKELLEDAWTFSGNQRKAEIELAKGDNQIEITIYKTDGWMPAVTGIWVAGPSSRLTALHDMGSMLGGTPPDPIFVDAKAPTILRSFSDLMKNDTKITRLTHAVNIGHPDKLHYTYNMNNGNIAQVWKGDFLDTSPMWDNRGDGSSRPRGAVLLLDNMPVIVSTISINSTSDTVTADANYKVMGYDVDENNIPTFRYNIFGQDIEDKAEITDGKYLTRTITNKTKTGNGLMVRLLKADKIEKIADDLFEINDKEYYIKLAGGAILNSGPYKSLIIPFGEKASYSIMW